MDRVLIKELKSKIGKEVILKGWVKNLRKLGKITFLELRDRSGIVQCIYLDKLSGVTIESVLEIKGFVKERSDANKNSDSELGDIEVEVSDVKILNLSEALPIPVDVDGYDIKEEVRLEYRYLDLRRERMQKNLRLRSKYIDALRSYFLGNDFVEIETPLLGASTKEGARDFVVPSRINPGKFYALPQSPQQYKQLLMAGGFERYFQLAKCVRDENLRADRGFEFTQIDLEMSFVKREDVMQMVENAVKHAVKTVGGKLQNEKFPIFDYKDAMEKFGADKFDLRSEEEKKDGTLAFAWVINFPFFKKVDTEDVAEVRDGKSGYTFTHNPFSSPIPEHVEWHLKGENIEQILTTQYDLVCNGLEVGGGSIRAHSKELLVATYKIMGYSDSEIEESVGHMLKAFSVGTPPHGGLALGVDRHISLLAGEKSIKEVVAFPMTYNGKTSVMNGPNPISEVQKKELGIEVISEKSPKDMVLNLLDTNIESYKHLKHLETKTSEEAASIRGTKLEDGAKAMILVGKKTKKNYMAVLPAHKKLDIKKLAEILGEPLEFEKPEEIKLKFNLEVGGVPPFGTLLGLETIYDEELKSKDEITFNIGTKLDSVIISGDDFRNLTKDFKFVLISI